jgi:hypothetical protein
MPQTLRYLTMACLLIAVPTLTRADSNDDSPVTISPKTLPGIVTAFYAEIVSIRQNKSDSIGYTFNGGRLSFVAEAENPRLVLATADPGDHSIVEFHYPWKMGVRYKLYVSARTRRGETVYNAWFGLAGEDGWQPIGLIRRIGVHKLSPPVGSVSGVRDSSGAGAFGQAWIKTQQYDWQPVHVMRFQPGSQTPATPRLYGGNLVAIETGLGDQGRGSDGATFEFDRTADTFPVLPE